MRFIVVAVSALLVSGCAIYPVEPKYDEKVLVQNGKEVGITLLDLEGSRNLLAGWKFRLQEAADDRQTGVTVASEILYYGTIFAVAGAAATKIGLRNTGLGMSVGSSLFTSHYQQKVQQQAFRRSVARLDCAEKAIAPIRPDVEETHFVVGELDSKELRAPLIQVPRQTTDFIKQTRIELSNSLQAIDLAAPSQEQLASTFAQFKAKQAEGEKKAQGLQQSTVQNVQLKKAQRITAQKGLLPMANGKPKDAATAKQIAELDAQSSTSPSQAQIDREKAEFVIALTAYPQALDACLKANPQ